MVDSLTRSAQCNIIQFDMENTCSELTDYLGRTDAVVHLAGVNRPRQESEFEACNVDFTRRLCDLLYKDGRKIPVVFSSSVHVNLDTPYGRSKKDAELLLKKYCEESGASVTIYRLKNVFGKWCRPNYNSVVATFCHNIARGLPISISDVNTMLSLVYIDDVVSAFTGEIGSFCTSGLFCKEVLPSYTITLGELAGTIESFKGCPGNFLSPCAGDEFVKKLYATYLSYLDPVNLY